MAATPKVVALGGGHGLHASLSALRRITDQLTAIVTVADDGGSSGRLRHEFGCLPPGDLRMAFAALCGDDRRSRVWSETLQWRFAGTGDLGGHPVGNILLLSLWQLMDDPVAGLAKLSDLLHSRGRVLPMALDPMQIEADVLGLDDLRPDEVSVLKGQSVIAKTTAEVLRVRLLPSEPAEAPETIQAVTEADYVMLGPGSWFTSVIPHLLVPQLSQAILTTDARRILMLNLAPAGETDGFTPSRHIELLAEHAPLLRLDYVLADSSFATRDSHLRGYVECLGGELIVADVRMRDGSARHDPLRLASLLTEIMEA